MNFMSCERIEERIYSHIDGRATGEEQEHLLAHLELCGSCRAHFRSIETLRTGLRKLDRASIPARLAVELRVLASHERVRQLSRRSFSARLRYWGERVRLQFDNLMRPVALPVAGGLLSALLLFGFLLPTLSFKYNVGGELPLSLRSDPDGKIVDWMGDQPRLESVDADVALDETVVEVIIDPQGRVFDYDVRQGQLTPEMQNILMFSKFTPAMFFYQPAWGRKLVVIPRRRNARS
jgi:hypothetical protein